MKEQIPQYSFDEAQEESFRLKELIEQGEAKDYSAAEKRVEREKAITEIKGKIEEARVNGLLINESAYLTSCAIDLEGDEALFANRVISRGSDPASLELALNGEISEPTMRAHKMGPGSLKEEEKESWLVLASASIDEHSKEDLSVTEKFEQFRKAVNWLETASDEEKKEAADEEMQKILNIPFEEEEIAGVKMRVYTTDRGFASAYWSGEEYAAVKQGNLTFVGSQEKSLEQIGAKVDKQLSPTFGIIFEK